MEEVIAWHYEMEEKFRKFNFGEIEEVELFFYETN